MQCVDLTPTEVRCRLAVTAREAGVRFSRASPFAGVTSAGFMRKR
jgi:hypothetical protein